MNSIKFREGAKMLDEGRLDESVGFLFRCKRADGEYAGSIYLRLSEKSARGLGVMSEALDSDDSQDLEKSGVFGKLVLDRMVPGVSRRHAGTAAISLASGNPPICLPENGTAYFDMAGNLNLIAYNPELDSHISFVRNGLKVAARLREIFLELASRKAQAKAVQNLPPQIPVPRDPGCIPGSKHNDGLPDYGFVKMKTVQKLLDGISRTTLDRHIREGFFPKPIHITPKCLGWPVEVIRAYFEGKREEQRKLGA